MEEREEDERATEARGVPARDLVLRARLPFEGRGVLGRPREDGRWPEISADFAALTDFFSVPLFGILRCNVHCVGRELGWKLYVSLRDNSSFGYGREMLNCSYDFMI